MFASVLPIVLQVDPQVLIVDNLLIGVRENGVWRSAHDVEPMGGFWAWSVLTTKLGKKVEIRIIEPNDAVGGNFVDSPGQDLPDVLVSGTKPGYPRPVKEARATDQERTWIRRHLVRTGKGGFKPNVTKVVKCDLDGNGTVETLVEAMTGFEDRAMPGMTPGACALVVLFTPVKGRVQTHVLYEDYVTSKLNLALHNRLRAVADMDGDGKIEVIASSDYYEGQSASLWRWAGGTLRKLAEAGAGA